MGPTKPTGTTTDVEYNGSTQSFAPSLNSNWMNFKNGTAKNAGESVDITVTPKVIWSDGTNSSVTFKWNIIKRTPREGDFTVNSVTVNYDGNWNSANGVLKSSTFSDTDVNAKLTKTFTDGNSIQRDAGTYQITLHLQETANFKEGDVTSTSWTLTINQRNLSAGDFEIVEGSNIYTYNGDPHTPTIQLVSKFRGIQPDTVTDWLTWKVGDSQTQTYANEEGYEIDLTVDNSRNFKNGTVKMAGVMIINKLALGSDISLDEELLEDPGDGLAATIQYNGDPRFLIGKANNLQKNDLAVATYRLDGQEISEEDLATTLMNVGLYEVEVTVSPESDQPYSNSYIPIVKSVTVEVTKAPVEIMDFSYELVTEGSPMTMRIVMGSIGTLDADVVVMYRGQPLVTTCSIEDNGNGTYTATVVYDTSLGAIPAGIQSTISLQYPGDSNHTESAPIDSDIWFWSTGEPAIPDDGGEVPIDPDKGWTEVVTPGGDVRFDVTDPDYPWQDGSTAIIRILLRLADEGEQIPDEDVTFVLETEGYRLYPDGSKTPIKYRVTPSLDLEVPKGKKPVVTLYDTIGEKVGNPDVLEYDDDSATFRIEADGSLSLRVGVVFKNKAVPIIPDEQPVPIVPQTEEEEGRDYTAAIAAGCLVALIAMIALAMARRSRN